MFDKRGVSMRRAVMVGMVFGVLAMSAGAQSSDSMAPMGSMSMSHGHMAAHMMLSAARPLRPGDQAKADAVAKAAKAAIEPYRDYKKALADGYRIFAECTAEDLPLYELSRTGLSLLVSSMRRSRLPCCMRRRRMADTSWWERCTRTEDCYGGGAGYADSVERGAMASACELL